MWYADDHFNSDGNVDSDGDGDGDDGGDGDSDSGSDRTLTTSGGGSDNDEKGAVAVLGGDDDDVAIVPAAVAERQCDSIVDSSCDAILKRKRGGPSLISVSTLRTTSNQDTVG